MSKARDLGDAANKANFLDNVTADIQPQLTPAGTIITFGGTSAPTGYLACQGQEVLISDYSALYAAIGTAWGTSSTPASHFILPDLRGEFLRGWDNGAGNDPDAASRTGGDNVGSSQLDQMQRITGNAGGNLVVTSSSTGGQSGALDRPSGGGVAGIDGSGSHFGGRTITLDSANSPNARVSSTTSGETRSRNKAVLYCIKT